MAACPLLCRYRGPHPGIGAGSCCSVTSRCQPGKSRINSLASLPGKRPFAYEPPQPRCFALGWRGRNGGPRRELQLPDCSAARLPPPRGGGGEAGACARAAGSPRANSVSREAEREAPCRLPPRGSQRRLALRDATPERGDAQSVCPP